MSNTSLLGSFGGQAGESLMFRNKILNGCMRIDQRNSGTSSQAANAYTVDRWAALNSTAPSFTIQQNAGSITPPVGYSNYLGCTVTNVVTPTAAQRWSIQQAVEGFNVADLAWGTANAQSITVSFWARSSLTGTFGGVIRNSAGNRSYPFTYSVSAANTWEYKTVIIPGDTTGTWLTNNGIGLALVFSLGAGSSLVGAAGSWAGSDLWSATGSVNVVSTNGATLYITGVQLEAGPTATPFERRPIGQELQLCQRYYEKSYNIDVVPGTASSNFGKFYHLASSDSAGSAGPYIQFKVTKRSTPLFTAYTDLGLAGSWRYLRSGAGADAVVNTTFIGQTGGLAFVNCGASWVPVSVHGHWTASAEL